MTAREAAALAVLAILLGYLAYVLPRRSDRLLRALRQQIAVDPGRRRRFYRRYLVVTAGGVAVYAATVRLGGHGALAAGAGWTGRSTVVLLPAFLVSLAVLDALLLSTVAYARKRHPEVVKKENQYAKVEFLIPRTPAERALWPLVCAGIAVLEECLYRGLLVLYVARLLDVSAWWFVLPSSVVFGLAHTYQGRFGVVVTAELGIGFAMITVMTGSLLPAIVGHFLLDLRLAAIRPPAPAAQDPAGGSAPPPPPPGSPPRPGAPGRASRWRGRRRH